MMELCRHLCVRLSLCTPLWMSDWQCHLNAVAARRHKRRTTANVLNSFESGFKLPRFIVGDCSKKKKDEHSEHSLLSMLHKTLLFLNCSTLLASADRECSPSLCQVTMQWCATKVHEHLNCESASCPICVQIECISMLGRSRNTLPLSLSLFTSFLFLSTAVSNQDILPIDRLIDNLPFAYTCSEKTADTSQCLKCLSSREHFAYWCHCTFDSVLQIFWLVAAVVVWCLLGNHWHCLKSSKYILMFVFFARKKFGL